MKLKGFTGLDNGKNLEGWTGKLDGWSVVDGAIHLDAKKGQGDIYYESNARQERRHPHAVPGHEERRLRRLHLGQAVAGAQLPQCGPKAVRQTRQTGRRVERPEIDIKDGVAQVKLDEIEKAWKIGGDGKKGIGLQRERGDFDFRYIRLKDNK